MSDIITIDQPRDWHHEVPRSIRRHAITGITLMAIAFGGFGYWAFTAPLAAAVISQGSFVATGRNKIVQHLEGGIIDNIYIEEGQFVDQGDPILSLDQTTAEASEREFHLREMRLQATSERLLAEYGEKEQLIFSEPLREAARKDPEVARTLDGQRLTFDITRKGLLNDIVLLDNNIETLKIRGRGIDAQLAALQLRSDILAEDITDKTGLLESGLVRKGELNALRRAQAEAEGQLARLGAEGEEVRQMLEKHHAQIARARALYRQKALDDLGPVAADLESVREKARAARGILNRAVVRAPVTGTVVRLYYHTPKGVIETGKPIAEILPADAPLIIEAQVPRTEIDNVGLGQQATVRLIALNQRTTPVLYGEVIYVSADSVPDDVGGMTQEIYLSRISISQNELERVPGFRPTPGMPVEVMIQTRERTFADYITRPVTDSFTRAFREN